MDFNGLIKAYERMKEKFETSIKTMEEFDSEYHRESIRKLRRAIKDIDEKIALLKAGDLEGYRRKMEGEKVW